MLTSLTTDEQLVLHHLAAGKGSKQIAAILGLPLKVVQSRIHTLTTKVLDELEAGAALPPPPPVANPAPHWEPVL